MTRSRSVVGDDPNRSDARESRSGKILETLLRSGKTPASSLLEFSA